MMEQRTGHVGTQRSAAGAFLAGGLLTAASGLAVQAVVVPGSDVPDDRWSFPWSADAFVTASLVYAVFHLLVVVGLVAFGRSGATGSSRAGRMGTALAVAGTLFLTAGELASTTVRDALVDDGSVGAVGALFGVGTLLSAVGLLLAGRATLSAGVWTGWRRWAPLVAGAWTVALIALPFTPVLALGVGIYGLCLAAMAWALLTQPAPVVVPPGQGRANPRLSRSVAPS